MVEKKHVQKLKDRVVKGFFGITFLGISAASPAETREMTHEYLVGPGQSVMDARESAVMELRKKAATDLRSYVLKDEKIGYDGNFEEQFEVISAAKMEVNVTSESIRSNNDGRVMLVIKAKVTTDDDELAERVKALYENRQVKSELDRITQEYHNSITKIEELKDRIINQRCLNCDYKSEWEELNLLRAKVDISRQQASGLYDLSQMSFNAGSSLANRRVDQRGELEKVQKAMTKDLNVTLQSVERCDDPRISCTLFQFQHPAAHSQVVMRATFSDNLAAIASSFLGTEIDVNKPIDRGVFISLPREQQARVLEVVEYLMSYSVATKVTAGAIDTTIDMLMLTKVSDFKGRIHEIKSHPELWPLKGKIHLINSFHGKFLKEDPYAIQLTTAVPNNKLQGFHRFNLENQLYKRRSF